MILSKASTHWVGSFKFFLFLIIALFLLSSGSWIDWQYLQRKSSSDPVSKSIYRGNSELNDNWTNHDEGEEIHLTAFTAPTKKPTILNIPTAEFEALWSLYNATDGPNWKWINVTAIDFNNTVIPLDNVGVPWNFSNPDVNPCLANWEGITCNRQCTTSPPPLEKPFCIIEDLILDKHNLNGTLPEALGDLTSLKNLSLSFNPHIYGSIPHRIGNITTLKALRISNNIRMKESQIPNFFYNLTNLQLVDFSGSLLGGPYPTSITSCNRLLYMDFSINRLTGSLTYNFCDMPSIEYLFLFGNHLTDSIPDCFKHFNSLTTLDLSANRFTGTIPESMYDVTSLISLSLNDNLLHGNITNGILNLTNLYTLELHFNSFHGTIPQLGGYLTNLSALSLQDNSFSGLVPIDKSISLTLLIVEENFFTGSFEQFNMSKWLGVSIAANCLTGTIPNTTDTGRTLLTPHLVERISDVAPIFFFPGLLEYFYNYVENKNNNSNENLFFYLDFSVNCFTGTMPSWAFTVPVLTYFYINDNMLSGSISSDYLHESRLSFLYLDGNQLTGKLPPSIWNRTQLINLRVPQNKLSGTIPEMLFHNNKNLKDFSADDNKFTGPIPRLLLPPNETSLSQFSVNGNQLTGTIPSEYFLIPQMNLFAASSNCLSGSLPDAICNAKVLNSLVLDGLSSAASCQNQLFPNNKRLNSFILQNPLQGSIPRCIFELPLLENLYLSGNELTGTIPDNVNISRVFRNLRLSYNRLTGSIPIEIQIRPWETLDLSYNKLRGHLSSGLNAVSHKNVSHIIDRQTNLSLYLDVNRLSGDIPSSVKSMVNISILNGNIFYCKLNREQLPEHDPKSSSYVCGSDTITQVILLWSFVIFCILLWGLYWKLRMKHFWKEVIVPLWRTINLWNKAFQHADKRASDGGSGVFKIAWNFFHDLRKYSLTLGFGSLLILMPIYRALNTFQSMFEFKYAWEFSAIYMTGKTAGSLLMLLFTLMIVIVFYLFGWRMRIIADSVAEMPMKDETADARETLANFKPSQVERQRTWTQWFSALSSAQWSFAQIRQYILVGLINMIVMTMANIGYVFVVVYIDEDLWIIFSQVALAIVKVFWNEVYIWRVWKLTKQNCAKRWLRDKENHHQSFDMLTSTDLSFLICCLLFNNIIAPCLSIALVSPSCYYNAFVATNTISAKYTYCSLFVKVARLGEVCIDHSLGTTTFSPPFIYSYNCTSLLPVNYVAVYMYMALTSGFLLPSLKIWWKYQHYRRSKYEKMMQQRIQDGLIPPNSFTPRSEKAALVMPMSLKPLYPHPSAVCADIPSDCTDTFQISTALRAMHPIFSRNRFIARVVGFLALLLSFGVLFPPLGVVMALSIVSISYFDQLNIGRILHESEELGYDWYREKLGYDVNGMVESIMATVFPLTVVASLLFGVLMFDTFGDKGGYNVGMVSMLLMISVPVFVWIGDYVLANYVFKKIVSNGVIEMKEMKVQDTIIHENPLHK